MRNYARKKSTPNKVAYASSTLIRNKSLAEGKVTKASYYRTPVKGKNSR